MIGSANLVDGGTVDRSPVPALSKRLSVYSTEYLQGLKRSELVGLCKHHGIKAVGKVEQLPILFTDTFSCVEPRSCRKVADRPERADSGQRKCEPQAIPNSATVRAKAVRHPDKVFPGADGVAPAGLAGSGVKESLS